MAWTIHPDVAAQIKDSTGLTAALIKNVFGADDTSETYSIKAKFASAVKGTEFESTVALPADLGLDSFGTGLTDLLQTGAGSVLTGWYDVTEWGAEAGTGTDQSTDIQAAIDAAAAFVGSEASNGVTVVYFPPGEFTVTTGLDFEAGLTFIGAPGSYILSKLGSYGIDIIPASGLRTIVRGLGMKAVDPYDSKGIWVQADAIVSISSCSFENFNYDGYSGMTTPSTAITLADGESGFVTITDCMFSDCGRALSTTDFYGVFDGNRVSYSTASFNYNNIDGSIKLAISSSTNCVLSNNDVAVPRQATTNNAAIEVATGTTCIDNTIHDFRIAATDGINDGGETCSDCIICRNSITADFVGTAAVALGAAIRLSKADNHIVNDNTIGVAGGSVDTFTDGITTDRSATNNGSRVQGNLVAPKDSFTTPYNNELTNSDGGGTRYSRDIINDNDFINGMAWCSAKFLTPSKFDRGDVVWRPIGNFGGNDQSVMFDMKRFTNDDLVVGMGGGAGTYEWESSGIHTVGKLAKMDDWRWRTVPGNDTALNHDVRYIVEVLGGSGENPVLVTTNYFTGAGVTKRGIVYVDADGDIQTWASAGPLTSASDVIRRGLLHTNSTGTRIFIAGDFADLVENNGSPATREVMSFASLTSSAGNIPWELTSPYASSAWGSSPGYGVIKSGGAGDVYDMIPFDNDRVMIAGDFDNLKDDSGTNAAAGLGLFDVPTGQWIVIPSLGTRGINTNGPVNTLVSVSNLVVFGGDFSTGGAGSDAFGPNIGCLAPAADASGLYQIHGFSTGIQAPVTAISTIPTDDDDVYASTVFLIASNPEEGGSVLHLGWFSKTALASGLEFGWAARLVEIPTNEFDIPTASIGITKILYDKTMGLVLVGGSIRDVRSTTEERYGTNLNITLETKL